MKSNTQYEVIRSKRIPYKHPSVLSDKIISLTGQNACEKCPHELRRVVDWDAEKERLFVFLTNIKNLEVWFETPVIKFVSKVLILKD